jgi:hypothetical protein
MAPDQQIVLVPVMLVSKPHFLLITEQITQGSAALAGELVAAHPQPGLQYSTLFRVI